MNPVMEFRLELERKKSLRAQKKIQKAAAIAAAGGSGIGTATTSLTRSKSSFSGGYETGWSRPDDTCSACSATAALDEVNEAERSLSPRSRSSTAVLSASELDASERDGGAEDGDGGSAARQSEVVHLDDAEGERAAAAA